MLSKEAIGLRIKEARENYSVKLGFKFTQSDLAEKAGLTRGYICDLEAGRAYPSIKKLQAIATACDVNLGWFNSEPVDVPDGLKDLGIDYITVTRELKEKGLSPDDIRKLSDIAKLFKK